MKKTLSELRKTNKKVDDIFEGIFSVGRNRARGYGRDSNKSEAIWTKDVRKNKNAYIEYIKNVDGVYLSDLPDNQIDTKFLNDGSYHASLVVLERNNIVFVGNWEGGLFENARFTNSTLYQSSFNGGMFKNATFDCDYTAWKADSKNFLGGRINQTKGGLLGKSYLKEGVYNEIDIFLIPVGSYLYIEYQGGNNGYRMIKSIDARGDDIVLEDISSGNQINLPWTQINGNGSGRFLTIKNGFSYSLLGIKNKIISLQITSKEPKLGQKSYLQKLDTKNDDFLGSILSNKPILLNLETLRERKVYQDFISKSEIKSLSDALSYIRSAKKMGDFIDYNQSKSPDKLNLIKDDDAIKSIHTILALKSLFLVFNDAGDVDKIKNKIKTQFSIDLYSFPDRI